MAAPSGLELATRWDRVGSFLFVYLWLVPILLVGVTGKRLAFLPTYVNYQYGLGRLFIHETAGWVGFHFQVRLEGETGWREPPEEDYFPARPFGHFSRLGMLYLIENASWESFRGVRGELTEYIARRHAELDPAAPPVEEVRFVATRWPVGGENARPDGPWETPPLSAIPREQWFVYPTDDLP